MDEENICVENKINTNSQSNQQQMNVDVFDETIDAFLYMNETKKRKIEIKENINRNNEVSNDSRNNSNNPNNIFYNDEKSVILHIFSTSPLFVQVGMYLASLDCVKGPLKAIEFDENKGIITFEITNDFQYCFSYNNLCKVIVEKNFDCTNISKSSHTNEKMTLIFKHINDHVENIKTHLIEARNIFLNDAVKYHKQLQKIDKVGIYQFDTEFLQWSLEHFLHKREASTVVLKHGQFENIFNDASHFLKNENMYIEKGQLWVRNYLFSGPSGSGKTSSVLALASSLNMSICLLSCNKATMTDDLFWLAIQRVPDDCILFVEEVDTLFDVGNQTNHDTSHVSYMSFLQATDGLICTNGSIRIFTTNHKNNLDKTLLSRFHKIVDFSFPTKEMLKQIVINFMDIKTSTLTKLVEKFVEQISSSKHISIRILQRNLMIWKSEGYTIHNVLDDKNKILTNLQIEINENAQNIADNYFN